MSNATAFRSMGRLAAVVGSLGLLMLGGCATAIRGTTQKVTVVTEPPGAECLVGNEMMDAPARIAATPGEAEVRRDGRPLQLSCRRTGYVVHDERVEAVSASEVDDVAQRRAMNGSAVLVGTAGVGIPTVAVTALTTGAGLGAAVALTPVFIGVAVLAPISVLVDATTGAYFGYPSLIPVLMTPDRFGSEGERAAYAADMHRRLDLADAALRADTAADLPLGHAATGEARRTKRTSRSAEAAHRIAGQDADRARPGAVRTGLDAIGCTARAAHAGVVTDRRRPAALLLLGGVVTPSRAAGRLSPGRRRRRARRA